MELKWWRSEVVVETSGSGVKCLTASSFTDMGQRCSSTQHADNNMQHATCSMQHAARSMQQAACNTQHAQRSMQHVACNMQHAACANQHAPRSMRHATCERYAARTMRRCSSRTIFILTPARNSWRCCRRSGASAQHMPPAKGCRSLFFERCVVSRE